MNWLRNFWWTLKETALIRGRRGLAKVKAALPTLSTVLGMVPIVIQIVNLATTAAPDRPPEKEAPQYCDVRRYATVRLPPTASHSVGRYADAAMARMM